MEKEGEFGLQTLTGRLITITGVKPVGLTQWKRDNFYIYGVVEPLTGEHFVWELSHLDTMCFEMFLEQFSLLYPEELHIIEMDNGAFHFSNYLPG